METCYRNQVKSQRTALPNIQTTIQSKSQTSKSGNRLRSENKIHNITPQHLREINETNSSLNGEILIEGPNEYMNKFSSSGSINDLEPTRDSSKNSFPKEIVSPSVMTPIQKKKEIEKMPPRRLKSVNSSANYDVKSFQKTNQNLDKTATNMKTLFKEIRLPKVSAKCWAVMDGKTGELLFHKKGNKRREIASLTKMMTCLCVCKLIKQFDINPKEIYVQVSKAASLVGGTSADLEEGDVLSIWDLLHALMLPSGNDAALTLAENFGTYIYLKSDRSKIKTKNGTEQSPLKVKEPVKYFLCLMNKTASELGLKFTYYANPHGLINVDSYSTAIDQAKLTYHLLKWDMIREIVNKVEYRCEIETEDQTTRIACWENTNKLLGRKGWQGVKTGVTASAGPSLSAYYENESEAYIVVLLSSSSMDIRWLEAPKLVNWTNKHKKEKITPVV